MGEERSECLCFMSSPCRLETGQLRGVGGKGLLLPRALVCFLPPGRSREECWWEALSFTLLTIICMWLCLFCHEGLVTFSILDSVWLWSEHPRLPVRKPAAFPTPRLLTAHQAFIAAQGLHARVIKAASTVLRYIHFWRAFLLGAQEVRVQILPPSAGS